MIKSSEKNKIIDEIEKNKVNITFVDKNNKQVTLPSAVDDIDNDWSNDVITAIKNDDWTEKLLIYKNEDWRYKKIFEWNWINKRVFFDLNNDWKKELILIKNNNISIYTLENNAYTRVVTIPWNNLKIVKLWDKKYSLVVYSKDWKVFYWDNNWDLKYKKIFQVKWSIIYKDINNDWINDVVAVDELWNKNIYSLYVIEKDNVREVLNNIFWDSYIFYDSFNYMNPRKW